ncbi:MAG: hypothetical protein GX962_10085 [Epulopiscium sp.]|nr:hypothetical protein [Candidatus Epulonipiscium sp.]
MHLAEIDYIATHQQSLFHQARAGIKVVFAFFVMGCFVLSGDMRKNIGLLFMLVILSVVAKLSPKMIFHLLLYPLVFGIIFSLMIGGVFSEQGLLLIIRAVGVAWAFLFLFMTTPYTDVFGTFSFFMPKILIDIFLFTYRSIFILLASVNNMFKMIRMRGGYHPWRMIRNIKNLGQMLGVVFLRALESSERMYQIYRIRGYEGKIPLTKQRVDKWAAGDLILIILILINGIGLVIL